MIENRCILSELECANLASISLNRYTSLTIRILTLVLLIFVNNVLAQSWTPVTDKTELRKMFSDTVITSTLREGVTATARYNADGTGMLDAWDDTFAREWKVSDQNQVCILISNIFECFTIEKKSGKENEYRGTNVSTGETVNFTVQDQQLHTDSAVDGSTGGAAQPSAEEIAAKLANPTSPVMTIGNNLDYVTFKGELPGADDQTGMRYVFQTVFPFKLRNGGSLFFRPAIPVMFNEPVPDGQGGFNSIGTDLGDTGFDFSYGITTSTGFLWGAGMVGTIPTATDDSLGKDLWGLGPELLLGVIRKWGVIGGVISHQWDVGGSGDGKINLTGINYFYAFPLGGGWQIAAGPSISYDHSRDRDNWTVPLGIGIAKTSIISGRPWKFQLQYWNYVEAADAFAPKHQVRLSINPVVSAPWNDGK